MRTGNCGHSLCAGGKGDHLESNFAAKHFGVFMDPSLNMSQHQGQQTVPWLHSGVLLVGWGRWPSPGLSTDVTTPKALCAQWAQAQGGKDIGERMQWRVYTYLEKQSKQWGARFFSIVPTGRARAKMQNLKYRMAHLNIRKHFSQWGWQHRHWQNR